MLLHRVGALAGDRDGGEPGRPRLTARELEIVRLLDEGLSNKEIAARLCIQANTVKNHVHNILGKLELSRRDEAASWARRAVLPLYGSESVEVAGLTEHSCCNGLAHGSVRLAP